MISFNEEKHTYTHVDTGEIYVSATQLLGKFKKPFDKDKHSQRVADKRGITQQEVLQEWESITKKSIDRGKNVHNLLENYIKFGETKKDWTWLYKSFDKQRDIICDRYDYIHSEKLLWNDQFKIAGTCDVLIERDSEFCILDFKTNKKMSISNPYKEFLKPPLDFLQYCEYNLYALQLSLYAYMFEQQTNKSIKSLSILYLNEDRFIPYHTPYLKLEIKELLNYYKYNKINENE